VSGNEIVPASLIAIGIIRKPIGLDGICAVEALGASLQHLKIPVRVFVGATETGASEQIIDAVEFRSKGPVCKFAGIDTMEQAGALRDLYIYIVTGELPPLQNDTYYHFELVGLRVHTDQGRELGPILAVHNFPTVDSIEVDVGGGETMMIPLMGDAIVDLDKKSGNLTIRHTFIEDL
jgi:16S rRNA processing protein RimM